MPTKKDKTTIGYFNPLPEKPDNWEEIKHGFTQACGCKNCKHEWSQQLEWNQPAINSIRWYDYCSKCKEQRPRKYKVNDWTDALEEVLKDPAMQEFLNEYQELLKKNEQKNSK